MDIDYVIKDFFDDDISDEEKRRCFLLKLVYVYKLMRDESIYEK